MTQSFVGVFKQNNWSRIQNLELQLRCIYDSPIVSILFDQIANSVNVKCLNTSITDEIPNSILLGTFAFTARSTHNIIVEVIQILGAIQLRNLYDIIPFDWIGLRNDTVIVMDNSYMS